MRIGVPRETTPGELRVAATPETVKKAIALGFQVAVESGAGVGAAIPDSAYKKAGAKIVTGAAVYKGADLIFVAQPPDDKALKSIAKGTVLIGMLSPLSHPDGIKNFAKKGLTALAMELLPRITRAQSMDVLSSQSNVAGYGAVLLAATHYPSMFPMMMTAAGTITPARVLVLGAGVAGLQAIATARRMGAVVGAYDVRPAVKEQVESLGATFVSVAEADTADAETSGGYAKEMSKEYKKKEQQMLADEVAKADIVITTALIPGKPAPVLITKKMAAAMKPGSVVVDLAAEAGGNCALTEPGKTVQKDGLTLVGVTNLPALWAADSSQLFARNLLNFITPMVNTETKKFEIDPEDEVVAGSLVVHDGKLVHPLFTEKKGKEK